MDNAQADADYAEAIRGAPKDHRYRHARGLFYEKTDRIAEARTDLQAALQLINPNDKALKKERGTIERDLQRVTGRSSGKAEVHG